MKKFMILFLLLLPMMAKAQTMSADKIDQVGVVVLVDKYALESKYAKGNDIILCFKDPKMADQLKGGWIYEEEYCYETKVGTKWMFQVKDDFISNPSTIKTRKYDISPFLCLSNDVKNGYSMTIRISDKYGDRKYGVARALFYRNLDDVFSGDASRIVGVEDNPYLAWTYIAVIFDDLYKK